VDLRHGLTVAKKIIEMIKCDAIILYRAFTHVLNMIPAMKLKQFLKGQSHKKVDELRVWGVSLGPN
jgi:hypothetical protein